MFNKIFGYISVALELAAVTEGVFQLVNAKQPLTVAGLTMVVMPGIQALETLNPKINIPPQIINDIIQAAVDSINKYVIKTGA